MRTLLLTIGLFGVGAAAMAGSDGGVSVEQIALENGCVYAPHPSGRENVWLFAHHKTGEPARCAQTVKARVSDPSAAHDDTPTRLALGQGFGIGAFR